MPQRKVDRSLLKGEAVEIFRSAIGSDHTRDPYERRLLQFLNYVGITPDKIVSIAPEMKCVTNTKVRPVAD